VIQHYGGNRVASAIDERIDVGLRLTKAREDIGGDDLWIGRIRAADADPDAGEANVAELGAQRLETVVAGEAAADA